MKKNITGYWMRILHRYIGFFMAGIMAVYAISGILLIYRDTEFLKKEAKYEKVFAQNLTEKELGKELKIKELKIDKEEGSMVYFKQGTYNKATGEAKYTKKELPFVLKKMTELHKSDSKHKYHLLNTAFGVALFFFVISSFWMFNYKSKIFKKGLIYAGIGFVLSLILLFV